MVYEAVRSSPLLADVIIATDSDEIMSACRKHGWKAQMTSASHRSGTERVHEISCHESADVYINVQGDEPMVRPEQIASLLRVMENPQRSGWHADDTGGRSRHRESECGESRDRSRRARSVFLPRHDSLRSRQDPVRVTSSTSASTPIANPRWTAS